MIFATIGTQAPFDRFIKILDEIAPMSNELIIAQTYKGRYQPKNIKTIDFLAPDEFDKLCHDARLIVAHAGMGTIISAMAKGKPIIVFPRIAALGEHRNEHQLATSKKMKELGYAYVANNKEELKEYLLKKDLKCIHQLGLEASNTLINNLINYIKK